MNNALVKDDGTWQDPEVELDPRADIAAGSRKYYKTKANSLRTSK